MPMLKQELAKKLSAFLEKAQEVPQAPAAPLPTETAAPPGGAPLPKPAPRPTAPAPKAVPGKPPKEGLEEEVKGQIEQEQRVKSIDNKLDDLTEDLNEKLDEITDVLEKGLLPEEKEEKFEEYKDDKDEEKEDEMSVDEFGIDTDSLVLSKEDTMKEAASLRERRKARLQKMSGSDTLSEEFSLEKDRKERFSPEAPAPKITKVKEDDVPKMFKLSELSLKLRGSSWEVLSKDDEVIAVIEKADGIENFASRDFAKALVLDMKKMGFEKALVKYSGKKVAQHFQEEKPVEKKPFPMKDEKKEEKKELKDEKKEEVKDEKKEDLKKDPKDEKKEDLKKDLADKKEEKDLKLRFARALKLAFTAMNKNLLNKNPLKGALFAALTDVAQLDPVTASALIEDSFKKSAEETVDLLLGKTEETLAMSDEAFVNYEEVIGDLPTATVDVNGLPEVSAKASALRKAATEGSLPITSHVQEEENESSLSKLQRVFESQKVVPGNFGVKKHASLITKKRRFGF
jgi:hypothetical protein